MRALVFLIPVLVMIGCDSSQPSQPDPQPVPAELQSNPVRSNAMVVTANPHATEAGVAVLRAGGSAMDAAVAIEAVLSLVEPQSSGLGGGGFMLHYRAQDQHIDVYEGRETAPSVATPDLFLVDGQPLPFWDAKNSGLSIGVPGMVSLLARGHQDQGVLPWSELFDSAIELAEQGFDVSPRLAGLLERYQDRIPADPAVGPTDAYHYFFTPDHQVKSRLVNPEYAHTLRAIGADPQAFYRGEIARSIVDAVQATPRAGQLSEQDIAVYQARKQSALCAPYLQYTLCGPPPASSWVAVAMAMGMLQHTPRFLAPDQRHDDWGVVADALRLAYADRDQYVADDTFVQVPLQGLLNPAYLRQRASLIDPERAIGSVAPGDPWAFEANDLVRYGRDGSFDAAGTTHFAVVDSRGNAVAMTASVESVFGSTRMAGGMILNNQLTDFSFVATDAAGVLQANSAAALKRPRSSMSPTIVLDENGEFLLSTGSPGGSSIISYTLKTLVGILDWGLSPQQAVDLPNMVARGDTLRIERELASPQLIERLRSRGHDVQESAGENSGLSVILRHADGSLEGGVDRRREGTIGGLWIAE